MFVTYVHHRNKNWMWPWGCDKYKHIHWAHNQLRYSSCHIMIIDYPHYLQPSNYGRTTYISTISANFFCPPVHPTTHPYTYTPPYISPNVHHTCLSQMFITHFILATKIRLYISHLTNWVTAHVIFWTLIISTTFDYRWTHKLHKLHHLITSSFPLSILLPILPHVPLLLPTG